MRAGEGCDSAGIGGTPVATPTRLGATAVGSLRRAHAPTCRIALLPEVTTGATRPPMFDRAGRERYRIGDANRRARRVRKVPGRVHSHDPNRHTVRYGCTMFALPLLPLDLLLRLSPRGRS